MSDEQLRELERRWRETGAVEDEARFLAERARAGRLSRDKLELAAYLGHRAALSAIERTNPPWDPSSGPSWLEEVVRGLRAWSKEAGVRAAIAASRTAMKQWEARYGEEDPARALDLAEGWLACPCERHAGEAAAHASRVQPGSANGTPLSDDTAGVARAAAASRDESSNDAAVGTVRFAVRCLAGRKDERRLREARATVLEAIQRELVPWALASTSAPAR
jgi:hypothetical protein